MEESYSSESSTDSEFERQLEAVEKEKERDEASHELVEFMRGSNIRLETLDGFTINKWLRGGTSMSDIIICGKLKKKKSVLLGESISKERILEIRSVAKRVAKFYDSPFQKFKSYIDRVTACIIEYEYRL